MAVVPPSPVTSARATSRPVLLLALGVLLLVRLAQMREGAAPDEGGFLVVAAQWRDGSSLYGDYWVDRPPLLITLFQLADLLGGLDALRVLGALAACASVTVLWATARRIFGERPAGWTAVVAAALLVTPIYGSVDVNGEMLALPFLCLGIRLAVEAVLTDDARTVRTTAFGAGLAAVAAVLVKQNLADVAVFAAVSWVLAWRTGRLPGRRLLTMVGFAAAGSAVAYGAVMTWAWAHGTSPAEVYEATYPFRVKAAEVLAVDGRTDSSVRLSNLLLAFLGSAAPLLLVGGAWAGFQRSGHPGVAWGLVASFGYGAFSVFAGGSYWLHYLIETVPVVALSAGAVAAVDRRVVRPLAGLVVLSAAIAATVVVVSPTPTPGTTVGRSVRAASAPGDTLVALLGDPDILRVADLRSPYPYLWSLPSRTLDPDMDVLRAVLESEDAPTWVVVRGPLTAQRLERTGIAPVLARDYQQVGTVCERSVYLRNGLDRPPLRGPRDCA